MKRFKQFQKDYKEGMIDLNDVFYDWFEVNEMRYNIRDKLLQIKTTCNFDCEKSQKLMDELIGKLKSDRKNNE